MIIGLTGGIGSGKSTVASMLQEQGFPLVDADQIARVIVEPGEPAYEQIVEAFGTSVLHIDGSLNRKALGTVVFKSSDKREILNQIMHPAIRSRMIEEKEKWLDEGYEHVVYDLPLLIENELFFMVDKVLLVYVDEKVQLERLTERDQAGEEEAKQRLNAQMPLVDKIEHADAFIDNNGSKEETERQLLRQLEQWGLNV
ncbi:dephospho-CoA kinase [Salsuginibacillus kocurii]|uniref:dephospho-CoA kinase n=1 Tax=Salsuginibacillus kocurii TaxID=427078 RepID=UPI0003661FE3|nr:dephospho-CoA kinase [Salsuginibacillus kocurii]